MIRHFERATRHFERVTRHFELVARHYYTFQVPTTPIYRDKK